MPKDVRSASDKWKLAGKVFIKFLIMLPLTIYTFYYYRTEIYDFSEPVNSHNQYYNPYQNWQKGVLAKANFHAHSKEWGGLTNGHNSDQEILETYKKLGFKVAGLSNYHKINQKDIPGLLEIPCYEHGFNIDKVHFLGINSTLADDLDFPFKQGISQKQQRVLNIRENASLVSICHPNLKNAITKKDVEKLSGYHLFEVLSPYATSFDLYDHAIMNGHMSWILASDDTHDLKKQPAGSYFVGINSEAKNKIEVLNALKSGQHVAYKSKEGITDIEIDSIKINNTEVKYSFSGNIKSVFLIEDGIPQSIASNGVISLKNNSKFIRFEVIGEKSSLYTNPIIRSNNQNLAETGVILAAINLPKTFYYRLWPLSLFTAVFAVLFLRKPLSVLPGIIQKNANIRR
ncbi:MAG: hypothetical protein LCH67_05300 [Bacteroidetes bacterium]|nr:hypothetical protein [Bacteroidota bacterium]